MKHLIDVTQYRAMTIAVPIEFEAIAEASFGHFEGDVLDSFELALNFLVFFVKIGQSGEDSESFVVTPLEDEPGRSFSNRFHLFEEWTSRTISETRVNRESG